MPEKVSVRGVQGVQWFLLLPHTYERRGQESCTLCTPPVGSMACRAERAQAGCDRRPSWRPASQLSRARWLVRSPWW